MKRYEKVKQILDALVAGQSIGGHGAFWRGLTHADFLTHHVFGQQLVQPGNSAQSSLILALRAQAPFGSDVGTTGAYFRRMPAGRPAAVASQIEYIADWIDAGCPDDDDPVLHLLALPGHQDPVHHNAYWREFDNWAMFNAPPDVTAAINAFFAVAPRWFAFAKSQSTESAWAASLQSAAVQSALALLSRRQRDTVERAYGSPIDVDDLFDSYMRFGSGSLPPDPLRPQDPDHKMNGREMWFFWAGFADACLRSNIDPDFWNIEIRAILIGLIHDGLFRERFSVQGFTKDAAGSSQVLAYARNLGEPALAHELRMRYVQSGV
jgi:hypothetical protein